MPEENESAAPGSAEDKDAEAVLALQEIAPEEPDVEAHMLVSATSIMCSEESL